MSKKETTSEVSRRLREKKAAEAEKTTKKATPKAKKQPAPAKTKPQPAKKVAKNRTTVRSDSKTKPELLAPADLKKKQDRANAVISQVKETLSAYANSALELHKQVQTAIKEESWRWCAYKHKDGTIGPFKNWNACLHQLAEDTGKSVSRVMEISGFVRATMKYLTPAEQAAIPVRTMRKLRAASAEAQKQGRELPPPVIETAKKPGVSEDDLIGEIEAAGLAPQASLPVDNRQKPMFEDEPDELLAETKTNTLPEKPGKGGSKVVEGTPGTAMQFGGKLLAAVEQWSKLYDDPKAHEPLTPMDRLEQVCIMFGEAPIDPAQILDSSVREALVRAARAEKEDFVMTNERAYEMLMHQPRKTAK